MSSTVKRDVRQIVSAILAKSGIDDFEIEATIAEEIHKYVAAFKKGDDMTKVRVGIIENYQSAHPKIKAKAEMVRRIEAAIKITPRSNNKWEDAINFLIKKDEEGQTIEEFWRYCKANVYNTPKEHQISEDPGRIKDNWLQAFPKDSGEQVEVADGRGLRF